MLFNTLDAAFLNEALEASDARFDPQENFNSDQGRQFTSASTTAVLNEHAIKISMDGKEWSGDSVFNECLMKNHQAREGVSEIL